MKFEGAQPRRFIQNGLMIYSSGTLHHQKASVRGYLYKQASEPKLFQRSSHYKRYFIISAKQDFVQIQDQPVTKKYKSILRNEILYLQRVTRHKVNIADLPWKFSFELKTTSRTYVLFAPNQEERELWVNGFHRILGVPIADPNFTPMGVVTKGDLQMHEEVTMTDGNNNVNDF